MSRLPWKVVVKTCRYRSVWLDLLLLFGLAAAVLLGMPLLFFGALHAPLILGLVLLGPCVISFLLTIVIPKASDWVLSSACAAGCGLSGAGLMIGGRGCEGTAVVLLSVVGLPSGWFGVSLARELGPQRCRDRRVKPPGDPRCPGCGYVLYYAKDQSCPDCGRHFSLAEIDLRLARWDGSVLSPWKKSGHG